MEGVSGPIAAAMEEVNANVLTEDNLLLRTCDHGVRHPCGHLEVNKWNNLTNEWALPRRVNPDTQKTIPSELEIRHEQRAGSGYLRSVKCCGCCPFGEPQA